MSDTKFTPGPWRIGKCGPNKCPPIGNMKGLMVAMCSHSTDEHPEIATANASLMAAAPEIYEALDHAMVVLFDVAKTSGLTHSDAISCAIAAQDALAKARGEM